MKQTRKNLLCALATLLLTVLLIGLSSPILMMKNSADQYQDFYRMDVDYDVLFLGTSHVMNGVSPMELWAETGIRSYNLSGPGTRMGTEYWMLKNALERAYPAVVVLDCALLRDEKTNRNLEYNHIVFDTMPLGLTKIQAVFDLFADNGSRLQMLFPFLLYHSRWSELTAADFRDHGNAMCGFGPAFVTKPLARDSILTELPETVADLNNQSTAYLERIADLCAERGITLVLTCLPTTETEEASAELGWVHAFAAERDLLFLGPDLLGKDLDPEQDFADDSHVNIRGARKITSALGVQLSRTFDLPGTDAPVARQFWEERLTAYHAELHALEQAQPEETDGMRE